MPLRLRFPSRDDLIEGYRCPESLCGSYSLWAIKSYSEKGRPGAIAFSEKSDKHCYNLSTLFRIVVAA